MDIRFASFLKHMTLCGAIYLLEKEQNKSQGKNHKAASLTHYNIIHLF